MLNIVLQAIVAVGLAVVAYFDVGGCLSAFSTTQFLSSTTPFFLFTTYRAVTPTSEDWALGPAFTKALSPFAPSTSPISSTYFHSNDIIPADEDAVISGTCSASSFPAVVDMTAHDILNNMGTHSNHIIPADLDAVVSSTPIASSFPAVVDITAHDILNNMGTHSNDIIPADEDAVISSTASAPSFPAVVDVTAHEISNNISTKYVHRAAPHGPRTSWIARKIVSLTSLKVYAVFTVIAALVFQIVLLVVVVGFQRFMSVDVLGRMDFDGSRAEQDSSDDLGIDTLPLQGDHVLVEDEDDFTETPEDANGSTASDIVFQSDSGRDSAQRVDVMVDDAIRVGPGVGIDTALGSKAMEVLPSIPGDDGSTADLIFGTDSSDQTMVPGVGTDILGRMDLDASRATQDSVVLAVIDERCVGMDTGLGCDATAVLVSIPGDDGSTADMIARTNSSERVNVIAEIMVPYVGTDILGPMDLDASQAKQDSDGQAETVIRGVGMDTGLGVDATEVLASSPDEDGSKASDAILRTDSSDQRVDVIIETVVPGVGTDILGPIDLDASQAEQDPDGLGMIDERCVKMDTGLDDDARPSDDSSMASDVVFRTDFSDQPVDMIVDTVVPGVGTDILGYMDLDVSQAEQDSDGLRAIDERCVGMDTGLGGDAMEVVASGEGSSMASDVVFRIDFSDQWEDMIVETMVPGVGTDIMDWDASHAEHGSDGLDVDMLPPLGRVVLEDRDRSTKTHNDTATDVIFQTDAGCDSDQRIDVMIEETIALLDRIDIGASQAEQDSNDLGTDTLPLRHGHVVIEEEDERNDRAIFRTDAGYDSDEGVAMVVDEMIEESGGGIDTVSYPGDFVMDVGMASMTFPRDNGEDDGRGDVLMNDSSIDEDDVSSGSLARIEDYLERAMTHGYIMPLPSAGEYDWNSGEEEAFFVEEDDSFTLGRMEIEPRFLERLLDVELPKDFDMSCHFDSDEIAAASPVLSPVDVFTEAARSENAVVDAVTPTDGGGIFRENMVEKGDDKDVLSSDVPWHTAADEDIIGLTMTPTPLHFGSRTALTDFMQPSASPRPHFSTSGRKRPLARSLFDEHDLEVVRRIITQDKRLPLRDLAQDRFPNHPAYVRAQKPLPLPGGPPSAPFEGKSDGARKRRLRREALAAERLEEGVL